MSPPTTCWTQHLQLHHRPSRDSHPTPMRPPDRPRQLGNDSRTPLVAMLWVAFALLMSSVDGARIVSFDNCLDKNAQRSVSQLQFHPLAIDAVFSTTPDHTLTIAVWGNVTGENVTVPRVEQRWLSGELVELPGPALARRSRSLSRESFYEPYGDSVVGGYRFDRSIDYRTGAAILDRDPNWRTNKATTLLASISVLSYTPSLNRSRFCRSANGVDGQGCPMQAVPWNG